MNRQTLSRLPKIVFFDIDDTLLNHKTQQIASSTRLALQKLRDKGIITAIATGRTPAVLPSAVCELMAEVGMEMLVAINGQYVRYQNQELVSFAMPEQQVFEIIEYLKKFDVAYAGVSHDGIRVSHESEGLLNAMRDLNIAYIPPASEQENAPIYQMLAFYRQEQAAEIEANLPSNIKSVRWHKEGVDWLDANGSKARGIAAALDKLGLQMSDAMAFGDGLNDLEMLQAVGFGVAMGNAHPDLQAIADYVCPSIENDGIWQALCDLGVIEA
ncbi:MAG: Cof-type HAD-IIB family hydrolase [Neisseria sp.]|nr:Cof-type HAD-IIB family hydrolase [Neisseria sp.]